ncbi:MAG: C69 family dipeptidase [Bacteroidales bacterium]|jgi:dipeptidase|nr:C69 family dipeptidase [Bacteroidales bacterium]
MQKRFQHLTIGLILTLSAANLNVQACTSFLVTKGASTDGSTMITYAADAAWLYGELYYRPAATHPRGTMLTVYAWHDGKNLGQIQQAEQTYAVVGYMNQHQVTLGETTFGGRRELRDSTGIMDYGNLMFIALQRSKTAREAIRVMHELVSTYGYCMTGESFSIADPNEVWIMELIGKGQKIYDAKGDVDTKKWTKGAVWVARKIPDGYISGHANHARITTFPIANPKAKVVTSISCRDIARLETTPSIEVVYAHDVVSYAQGIGIFSGTHDEFSFSDVYAPLDFGAMRFCEARVWSGFRKANRSGIMDKYEDYARGENPKNRMPLWIKPDRKLSVQDVFDMMRDHYQGTSMDMTKDPGTGPFVSPYRWRPMRWELNGQAYIHERAISTQQTAHSFVSQSRSWLPNPIGGILWFGVDDTYTTVWMPMYAGMTKAPHVFEEGNGGMVEHSHTSAFWLFNLVTNFTYSRYKDMIVDIQKVQSDLEQGFIKKVAANDAAWKNISDHEELSRKATEFSLEQAQYAFDRWKSLFYDYLLVKYLDGNVKKQNPDGSFQLRHNAKRSTTDPLTPRYPDWFYQQIVDHSGKNLRVVEH